MQHIFNESNKAGVIRVNHVVISTYSDPVQVQKYINKRLEPLYLKPYRSISSIKDKVTFITYMFPVELSQTSHIIPIAKGIVDFIQHEFAGEYAKDVIQTQYGFSLEESNRMMEILREAYQSSPVLQEVLGDNRQTEALVQSISKAIWEENNLCVDGWIKFRLGEYKAYIMNQVERIVFEYLAYQEYEEFIGLLKQFIKTQQPLMKFLHLIPKADGSIGLYDDQYEEMTSMCLEEYAEIRVIGDSYNEDVILSTLLTISPLKIRIHKKEAYENQRLVQTIQMIYGDKVSLCESCQHCELQVIS